MNQFLFPDSFFLITTLGKNTHRKVIQLWLHDIMSLQHMISHMVIVRVTRQSLWRFAEFITFRKT